MKKTAFSVLATVAFGLLLTSAKAPSVPAWVTDVHGVYPDTEYIAALGKGGTDAAAKSDAVASIASYFSSQVSVNTNAIKDSIQKSENGQTTTSTTSEMIQTVNISNNAELFGTMYTEPYFDKKEKTHYVAAYIDRKAAYQRFRPKIEDIKITFYGFYEDGDKYADSEPFLAAKYYEMAQDSGDAFSVALDYARAINHSAAAEYAKDSKKVSSLKNTIKRAMMDSVLYADVTGDFNNTITAKTVSFFESKGFIFADDKDDALYVLKINIKDNSEVERKGTEDEITAVYPALNISVVSKRSGKTFFSFAKKYPKTAAYTKSNPSAAKKKGFTKIADNLLEELSEAYN